MPSPTRIPRDSRPTAVFIDFVSKTKQTGVDGTGKKAHFLASADLASYWSRHNIETVVYGLGQPIRVPVDVIEARYLRVFSMLVFIDRATLLEEFATRNLSDGFFPLYKFPPIWPDDSPMHRDLYELIKEHQWMFFPLVITQGSMCNRQLRKRHILPIVEREILKDNMSVTVSKIKVPWGCQRIFEEDKKAGPKRPDITFVLKTYKSDTQRALYDAELDAWVALGDLWSDNIVMCWGGFVQTGTYNLVFEYANRGNLGSFLRHSDPPSTAGELVQFWSNLVNILHGLHRFHQHKIVGTGTLGGIHQDLHMQNILLVDTDADTDALPSARFAFTPKLADFGNSHVRVAPTETDIMDYPGRARYGHQTFEPPEQSDLRTEDDEPEFNGGPDIVTPRADIWAIGGVFSQAVAWSVLGAKGMREYFEMCLREGGLDKGGAFHNGVDALQAVKTMHRRAIGEKQAFDALTPRIVDIVEKHMLVRASERLTAKQLFGLFQQILQPEEEKEEQVPVETLQDNNRERAVTLDEVEKWRLARLRDAPQEPSVGIALWRLHQNLNGRRYVFLLDDSPSMSGRLALVRQTLITLTDLVGHLTSRPVEIVLASDPTCKLHRLSREGDKIAKFVNTLPFDNIPELLEESLARVVDTVMQPHLATAAKAKSKNGFLSRLLATNAPNKRAPINLFILTDGNWRGRGRGLELPLRRLVRFMQSRDLDRGMAFVQFVQFGGFSGTRRNLEYLVEEVGGPAGYGEIVDTRIVHGAVQDIFLGNSRRRGENEPFEVPF